MLFYKRHIGDYLRDTLHLSLLEHGAYARLLDLYYTREGALPDDQVVRLVGARSKQESIAVRSVLLEFFTLKEGDWHHKRCDQEIADAAERTRQARENGARGGRPKKPDKNPSGFIPDSGNEPEGKLSTIHKPLSKNPEDIRTPSEVARAGPGPTPEEILAEYPRTTNGNRATALHHIAGLIDSGEATAAELLEGTRRYRAFVDAGGRSSPQFVQGPDKFYARTRPGEPAPWAQAWEPPPTKAETRLAGNLAAADEAERRLFGGNSQ